MRDQAKELTEQHLQHIARVMQSYPGCEVHTEWPRQRVADLQKAWTPEQTRLYKQNQEHFKALRLRSNGTARLGAEASEERRFEGLSLRLFCNKMAQEAHRVVKSGHDQATEHAINQNDVARVRLTRMVRKLRGALEAANSCVAVLESQEEQLRVLQDWV